MPNSPGDKPCTELETRGGIWRYDANKTGQKFSPNERYATGIRNAEGIGFDASAGRLFVTQHGRDQLGENWPKLYTPEQGANLPAEELRRARAGRRLWLAGVLLTIDGQQKLVLAPEYGGDGGKAVGVCATSEAPVAAFPAHWAPNALRIYNGAQVPGRLSRRSLHRLPWLVEPRARAAGRLQRRVPAVRRRQGVRATTSSSPTASPGPYKDPGRAAIGRRAGGGAGWRALHHRRRARPDLASHLQWRRLRQGHRGPETTPAATAAAAQNALPPEGVHPDAGRQTLPTPPGATPEQVALGGRIFRGEVANGACAGCHGSDAGGSPVGPPLNTGHWLWSDGSLGQSRTIIEEGVAKPKRYQGVMPPMGGSPLTKEQLAAVSAYVWAISHADKH